MPEKDVIFNNKTKYNGIFSFPDFYKFLFDWLKEEGEFDVAETKYSEKIMGDSKNIDIEWVATRKVTDYFKFQVDVVYRIIGLTNVELTKEGRKEKMNKGSVEIGVKGTIIRDYAGKFEKTASQKFLRATYEKWVIPSRLSAYETKLAETCDEFLAQAKAYLDLLGKK